MENKTELTNKQITGIYNGLAEVDIASAEALERASKETESKEYTELEKIDSSSPIVGIVIVALTNAQGQVISWSSALNNIILQKKMLHQ